MRLVRITGVPTGDYIRLQRHVDDLLREFEIIDIGARTATAPVPDEVRSVIVEVLQRYADQRSSTWQQAEAAEQSGRPTLDLEVVLPAEAAIDAERLLQLFDRADDLSRAGVLLTRETPPELVSLRRRILEHVVTALRTEVPQ